MEFHVIAIDERQKMKVAAIGECMVELVALSAGTFSQSFGGDTLNTAVYLARLGISTDYVTVIGDDALSDQMIRSWQDEGLGVGEVRRVHDRLPGLYMIQRDEHGERSFLYWRDNAPARDLFKYTTADDLARLVQYDWIYFSGITLSLYDAAGLARLIDLFGKVRKTGGRIAFDGNYRPRGWRNREAAQEAFKAVLPHVDLALPTFDDEHMLFDDSDARTCAARLRTAGVEEVVVKSGAQGCLILSASGSIEVPAEAGVKPVDTTAAGDAFNAAYLAARIRGQSLEEAARAGHKLAAAVICYPGAIIPQEAMRAVFKHSRMKWASEN
jgi:2-dehydro-3-deoxygluconokinase